MYENQPPFTPPPPPPPGPPAPVYPPAAVLEAPPFAPPAVLQPAPAPIADPRTRTAGIALLVTGAVLLVGLVARSWFTARGGSIGVLGIEECRSFGCTTITWLDAKRAPDELKLFASLGLLGGLAALGFLIHAGVVLMKYQPGRVKLGWLNGLLAVAAFGCVSFFLQLAFGEMSRRLSISYAGFFAIGGIIAASVIVTKWVRPLMRAASPR